MAAELTAHDALAAHVDAELKLDPQELTSPTHAATASALSFLLGAALPLIAILLPPPPWRVPVTVLVVLVALGLTGWLSARIGGGNPAEPCCGSSSAAPPDWRSPTASATMERTYTVERAAHARAVATVKGRRIGRPSVVDPHKLAYAVHLRAAGDTIAEIVAKTGITRSSLYRHLPIRPADTATAASTHR